MDIYFITTNQNKVLEINDLLLNTGIKVLSQSALGFNEEIIETGKTFVENAVLNLPRQCMTYIKSRCLQKTQD